MARNPFGQRLVKPSVLWAGCECGELEQIHRLIALRDSHTIKLDYIETVIDSMNQY